MGGPYCQWRRPYVRVELNSEQADAGRDMGWTEISWGRWGRQRLGEETKAGASMERALENGRF